MRYAAPGEQGSLIQLQKNYGNFINGEFVAPVNGNYFTNTSPVNGSTVGSFRALIALMSIMPWPPPLPPLMHGVKPRRSSARWCC